jgi:hypothetical protein
MEQGSMKSGDTKQLGADPEYEAEEIDKAELLSLRTRSVHKHGWLSWIVLLASGCDASAPSRPAEAPVGTVTFPSQHAALQPGEVYVPPWPAGTLPPPPTTPPMMPVQRAPDGGTVREAGRGGGASRPIGLRRGTVLGCAYPREADAAGVDAGFVSIQVTVGVDGAPLSATVQRDPGYGFGEAARLCALRARYEPALDQAGTPIVASTVININFQR